MDSPPLLRSFSIPARTILFPSHNTHSSIQISYHLNNCTELKHIREMASTSAVSMALPLPHKRLPAADSFVKPLPLWQSKAVSKPVGKFEVKASLKEKAMAGLTAAAITASMVVPDMAQAAGDVTPSLKNFLLSIVAGGVVLTAIVGAVIGVSNFDPVKRT